MPLEDLAVQLGLGKGTARHSPVWHTVERLVRFRFATLAAPGELHVYTEVPPVSGRQLERLPGWCRGEHDRLLDSHLDGLARSAGQAPPVPTVPSEGPPAHVRMAQHLERITTHAAVKAPSLGR